MSSLADAAGKFAEKMAELLDVFDFSFFVAGSAALGALLVWLRMAGVDVPPLSTELALVAVVAAYALGMLCYAVGRAIRTTALHLLRRMGAPQPHPLAALYVAHRLGERADYAHYGDGAGRWSELYTRLWVLLRSESRLREAYQLARRYWVLGAAYDGLSVAALLWLLPVTRLESIGVDPHPGTPVTALEFRIVLSVLLVAAALFCLRQASHYHGFQYGEIAATAAYFHQSDAAQSARTPGGAEFGVDEESRSDPS